MDKIFVQIASDDIYVKNYRNEKADRKYERISKIMARKK